MTEAAATTKSIFEEESTSDPPKQSQINSIESTKPKEISEEKKEKKENSQNTEEKQQQQTNEIKQTAQKLEINTNDDKNNNNQQPQQPEEEEEEKFVPNSLGDAKKKYLKNKYRDAHKYEAGSPRSSSSSLQSKITKRITETVDEYKEKLSHSIDDTTEKLLSASDDVVAKLSQSTGIKFAPINIPLKRRRQTFAVLIYSLLYFFALMINFYAFRYWTGWKFYLYILFLFWKLMYQTFHKDGGLPIPWMRNAFFWKWFVDFFPIRLSKTYDLDDTGETSYLFGYHPHGIIGMGAVGTFACMASGFNKLFPGVDVRLMTLRINFFIPFFDLYLTFMGICDASRESCNAILSDPEKKSLCLVLGGAKESLEANPGVVQLYLKNRKGFVKVALENGASLVPVFGFGENELFSQVDNPQGSFVRKLQNTFQRRFGFAIPLFHGRGIFQYNYGLLPRRHAIDVVFGKPIACPKLQKSQITPEHINKYHTTYCNELKALFDSHKEKFYNKNDIPELHFI